MFDEMYSVTGRPSVPPEMLLKASVLMAMYSMRSERAFCERLNYDMLFKWFLDLRIDDPSFDASTFSKNRQRLLDHEVADLFFEAVVRQAKLRRYVSSDHFSVDGTLLQAWASHKSFKPNDDPASGTPEPPAGPSPKPPAGPSPEPPAGPSPEPPAGPNPEADFRGRKRSNDTHTSSTDPEARLYRKSTNTAAVLGYLGHVLMENRSGLLIDAALTAATGYAERDCATEMLGRLPKRKKRRTVAGDKGYDTKGFVAEARDAGFTPHVAQNTTNRRSAIDRRTTRHGGYGVSQRKRKRVEEPFGWVKTVGGGRKLRFIGRDRNRAWFKTDIAVYNLIRIVNLDTATR